MCIYTVKKQKLKKYSRGVRDSPEPPQIRRLRHKDLGMSCYIQEEYSVCFHW